MMTCFCIAQYIRLRSQSRHDCVERLVGLALEFQEREILLSFGLVSARMCTQTDVVVFIFIRCVYCLFGRLKYL